ncbi:DUF6611 family protein [Frondihabitans sp. 762G35]|uniref:DUF6611 family protein n=1 Tax=Frondihabitans sp. 762G35 TaxID=1446794 RepID=UPI000E706520|nr:DUF6611 family protein [Frondihabitans sp. 762G35]
MTSTTDRSASHRPSTAVRRAVTRLTEGEHRWGSVDVNPGGRSGWCRTRLTVYPPGTNAGERRLLNAFHAWPVAGAAAALVTLVVLDALPQWASFAAAVAIYALGFVVGAALTRRLRPRLRHLTVSIVAVAGGARCYGDGRLLQEVRRGFDRIDRLEAQGRITPVAYELRWAALYDRLEA